ncbi:hypothetical protein GE061_003690 [Apolygus lucorum]|uniref:EamA domain-containing protein n=1 Tax=Apolygus lucorum TaxID=248454 RepID=A0A8S9X2R5_APOLU|nr:hypothetical protein GE061_003690 [Apolygus lucorum]
MLKGSTFKLTNDVVEQNEHSKYESLDSWFVSGLCWLLMVCINSVGMMMFSKSLNESTTSFVPTLLTTASVYCASALFGVIVFSETTSPIWWFGTFLILAGILVISSSNKKDKRE